MSDNTILKKIVFVDDDPLTNELHKTLSNSVHLAEQVECYETAEEMLAVYEDEEAIFPELFFIDIGLPTMDGHELGVTLRKMAGFKKAESEVCFLTASKDIRDVIAADNNEFDHYFWKPLDKSKLQALLRDIFKIELD